MIVPVQETLVTGLLHSVGRYEHWLWIWGSWQRPPLEPAARC